MSFVNISHRANISSNATSISALDTRLTTAESSISSNATNLSSKQDAITATTDITLQNLTAKGTVALKDSGDVTTVSIVPSTGKLKAKLIEYEDGGSYTDVKTKIDTMNDKLTSATTILTSSVDSQDYDLETLLNQVVTNKVKLSTFVDELNNAVGDTDSGVISLMEQVAQNKADIATESSARATAITTEQTARASAVSGLQTQVTDLDTDLTSTKTTIASSFHNTIIVEGESMNPVFSCGSVPFEVDFGIPFCKASELEKICYVALTPDGSITGSHSMTLNFKIYSNTGSLLTTNAITFTNRRQLETLGTPISLPEGSNVVVEYASKVGSWHPDSRFRLSLLVRSTDIDAILA